ncbi:MAG: hypothetical protein LBI91_03590 [Spirochaetaceae bacterium]|jgi:hypothetical protein|nr:hypothetical protein [Spirochaetaceae bacterium]
MAIQPIDLQTLFTQIDKVGKDQSVHREGAQLQASLVNARAERLEVERDHSVNEAQDTGQGGAERVKDRQGRRQNQRQGGKEAPAGDEAPQGGEGEDPRVIRDPCLGQHLDVSG